MLLSLSAFARGADWFSQYKEMALFFRDFLADKPVIKWSIILADWLPAILPSPGWAGRPPVSHRACPERSRRDGGATKGDLSRWRKIAT